MLTCTIQEQVAIPVRALLFITAGTFEPLGIADLFYDPESNDSREGTLRGSLHIDGEGNITRVPPGRWKPVRKRIMALERNDADPLDVLAALPAGTFVWWIEFKKYYEALIDDASEADAQGFRPAPAGEWGWDEAVSLSAQEAAVVWQGFEVVMPTQLQKPRAEAKNSRAQHLEALGREIDEIISEAKERGVTVDKGAMPGEKVDLIDILVARKESRSGRADSTYFDDFSELNLRWLGGRNRSDRTLLLDCFGLKPRAI